MTASWVAVLEGDPLAANAKKIDNTQLTNAALETVYRQRIQLAGDGTSGGTPDDIVAVTDTTPSVGDFALAVREVPPSWARDVFITGASGAVPVTDNGGSLTVDGTVAVTGVAQDATLTGGTQKAIVRGGAKGATAAADVTSSASGANHQLLDVAIYDAAGNQITSFGGSGGASFGAALPATGSAIGGSDGTNLQSPRVFDGDTGAGAQWVMGAILRKAAAGGTVEAGTSTDPLRVDPTGTTTQPISAASLPLPTGAALDATLTGGTQKAIVRGGAKGTSAAADVTSTATGANHQALDIAINDAAGAQIGIAAAPLRVDPTGTTAQPITDNAGSLTVDAPVGTPVFARLSDGAAALIGQKVMASSLPVAIASDQSAITVAQATAANLNATLGAGANTIGSIANITTAVTPGTAAANLGKAEDAAAASGDTGVAILGVRADTHIAATTNANGDYSQISVDQGGVQWVRPRLVPTYGALYRLAAATAGSNYLSVTFAANTDKQLATIYHTAVSTKTVRIKKVSILIEAGAAGIYQFELRRLSATTAPATGNPTITPGAFDSSDAAAEAACLALPTTQGSYSAADSPLTVGHTWNSGAAAATTNPSGLAGAEIVLFDATSAVFDYKPLTMRSGVAEGFGVIGRCASAIGLNYVVYIMFTEE